MRAQSDTTLSFYGVVSSISWFYETQIAPIKWNETECIELSLLFPCRSIVGYTITF